MILKKLAGTISCSAKKSILYLVTGFSKVLQILSKYIYIDIHPGKIPGASQNNLELRVDNLKITVITM